MASTGRSETRLGGDAIWERAYWTLKAWTLESGTELCTLIGHTSWVHTVAVTADGRLAVSGSDDRTLKVWDLGTAECLCTWSAEGDVFACAIASGMGSVIAGDTDGYIHFLRLENVTPGPPICTAWLSSGHDTPAFGCLHCRVWSEVPSAALGTELPCPHCGKAVKLNPFVIEADWRPVAAAWRGAPEGWTPG
jgi:WD40 repeat protein